MKVRSNQAKIIGGFTRVISYLVALVTLVVVTTGEAWAANVTIAWDAPTTNADGTPLTDLQNYKVAIGPSSTNYTTFIPGVAGSPYVVANLGVGT